VFCGVYSFIFGFGVFYIYRLLRAGPAGHLIRPTADAVPNRPMSVIAKPVDATERHLAPGE
jgi:cytochrome d ubiquinol oxidase subunit I